MSKNTDYFKMNQLTPLLNNELLTTAIHIPTKYKYDVDNEIGKLPLRAILEKNNVASLVTKEKLGFNVNTINLWKSYGHNLCKEFLDNSRIVKDSWINNDWIQKHIDNPDIDVKYVNKFLGILAFEIWYRLFITKEMNGFLFMSSLKIIFILIVALCIKIIWRCLKINLFLNYLYFPQKHLRCVICCRKIYINGIKKINQNIQEEN